MQAPVNLQQRAKLFISYRREDSSGHAGRLFDRINNHFGDELKIFMDIDSLTPGEDFVRTIEQAVDECDVFVAIIGKDWLAATNPDGERRLDNPNDFVRVEIEAGLSRNIKLIPILVQGANMPNAKLLPEALANLSRRHALELSDTRWNHDVVRLIKILETIVHQKKESTPSAVVSPAEDVPVINEIPPPQPSFVPDFLPPHDRSNELKTSSKIVIDNVARFLRKVIKKAPPLWHNKWYIVGLIALILFTFGTLIFVFIIFIQSYKNLSSYNANSSVNNTALANANNAAFSNSTDSADFITYKDARSETLKQVVMLSGAGDNYNIVGTAPKGVEVKVISRQGSWYQIEMPNYSISQNKNSFEQTKGWVHGLYLKPIEFNKP